MCGIAGVVGSPDPSLAGRLTGALRHRGPDGMQIAHAGCADLGATRLSIVDPTANVQLHYDETRSLCLTFNGEIYNHRELRAELIGRGHRFRTGTDSEVVVHLFEEFGRDCVSRLRGMFAFAVASATEVLLARDRLGIKPLVWTQSLPGGAFAFASETAPLISILDRAPSLDLQAFADSVAVGYPVGAATLLSGVYTLPPGHTMLVRATDGGVQVEAPVRYFALPARTDTMTYEEAEEAVEDVLADVVRRHLDADVEVGFTLSGGLDSTVLALFAAELTEGPLRTYTVADHAGHPDVSQAESIARQIGAKHTTHIVDDRAYLDAIPRLVRSEEGPSSLLGVPFQLLCERIARDVKTCMHGEGADEVFGGYVEYLARDFRAQGIRRGLARLRKLGIAPSDGAVELISRLTRSATLAEHLDAVFAVNLAEPLQRMHLDPVDRTAMSAGLEMRVPYLDDELVELTGRIPTRHLVRADIGVRKYLLRRLAVRRFGRTYLPSLLDVVLREKLGVPSSGVVALQRFDALCERRLPADYLQRHEFGAAFETKRHLLMFDYFRAAYLDHRGDVDAVGGVLDFIDSVGGGQR